MQIADADKHSKKGAICCEHHRYGYESKDPQNCKAPAI